MDEEIRLLKQKIELLEARVQRDMSDHWAMMSILVYELHTLEKKHYQDEVDEDSFLSTVR